LPGSVRLVAGAPLALVDHARGERPGLAQLQRDVLGDRREKRRAAADHDRIAEYAQLVDEAELDRRRGESGDDGSVSSLDRTAIDRWSD
jgi:hypothetical protein